MPQTPQTDALGRTPISEGMKRRIEDAFSVVPVDHTAAALVLVDTATNSARLHWAAKVDKRGTWKVAGGASFPWDGKRPEGWIGVIWSK